MRIHTIFGKKNNVVVYRVALANEFIKLYITYEREKRFRFEINNVVFTSFLYF
jgi:hypothetical protein